MIEFFELIQKGFRLALSFGLNCRDITTGFVDRVRWRLEVLIFMVVASRWWSRRVLVTLSSSAEGGFWLVTAAVVFELMSHISIRCCWDESGYWIVLASDVVTEVDRRDG